MGSKQYIEIIKGMKATDIKKAILLLDDLGFDYDRNNLETYLMAIADVLKY